LTEYSVENLISTLLRVPAAHQSFVYLSVIIRRDADGWRIAHYQVSRLD
jgi:hypothetical protein